MASGNASDGTDVVGGKKHSAADIARVNNEAQGLMSIGTAFITQPFIVSRTLMQIGYEPVAPELGRSLFTRTPGYYYPNTFRYLLHLRSTEGLPVLFTGFTAKMINAFTNRVTEQAVDKSLRQLVPYTGEDRDLPAHKKGLKATLYEVTIDCISKSLAVVVTQPLHVVMVRMVCSIVDKEEAYRGFFSSIKEIYNTEGISGFFSGLVPRWISEVVTIAMTGTIMYGVYRVIENALEDETVSSSPNYHALVQFALVGKEKKMFYVYGLVYQYQLTSTVTAASCPGLKLGLPLYDSWKSCYSDLSLHNQLKRGQSMFFREARL